MTQTLTPQEEAFALAFCDPICRGATDAYRRAGYSANAKPGTINSEAYAILNRPHVALRIEEIRKSIAERVIYKAVDVIDSWMDIHTADAAELTHIRRWCCRYCHGDNGRYQWIDEEEFARAVAEVIDANAARPSKRAERPLPDVGGGFGYDRVAAPNPACSHCQGDGIVDVFIADTSSLSPRARRLFAGVKTTQHGIEIKTRDQDAALQNIAKYLGMLAERHMHGGDPNNPTPIAATSLTGEMSAKDASKLYGAYMAAVKP